MLSIMLRIFRVFFHRFFSMIFLQTRRIWSNIRLKKGIFAILTDFNISADLFCCHIICKNFASVILPKNRGLAGRSARAGRLFRGLARSWDGGPASAAGRRLPLPCRGASAPNAVAAEPRPRAKPAPREARGQRQRSCRCGGPPGRRGFARGLCYAER